MFEDSVARIRCPSCGSRMEEWMMKSDSMDDPTTNTESALHHDMVLATKSSSRN